MFIGFRATGKTTIGKLVAQKLGYLFLDTDVLIENRTGITEFFLLNLGFDTFC